MTQYIDKYALVAEINRRIMDAPIDCYGHQRVWAYNDVKIILDTLEVKDVDLKKEDKNLKMLLDAIDYSFLQTDGSYDKSLTYPVIDKVLFIKKNIIKGGINYER